MTPTSTDNGPRPLERLPATSTDEHSGGWRAYSACAQVDPDLWFPEKGSNTSHLAKRICHDCPVKSPCLQYAIASNQKFGVWGGHTSHELRQLRNGHDLAARRIACERGHQYTTQTTKTGPTGRCICLVCRGDVPVSMATKVA